jgi:HTH-type transcriptional regulator/antitoxin HipB
MAVNKSLFTMENAFFEQLATLIREHRKHSGLSQQALAKHAGVGKTVIYDIEHGKETIQLNTLLKVLSVLNIQIEFKSPLITQKGVIHA